MKLQHLEYFITVSHSGSLGKAAERLFTTQPNVSKVINSLEQELGTALFDRTTKGLRLNEYGKAIYDYAENILKNSDIITSICRHHIPDTFSISTFQSGSLAHMIVDLFMKFPDMRIVHRQGNVGEIVKDVEEGISELGIICIAHKHLKPLGSALLQKNLEFTELGTAKACIGCGPKSPLYGLDSVDPAMLPNLHFVSGLQDYFSEFAIPASSLGMASSDALTVAVSSGSSQTLTLMVEQTDLVDLTLGYTYKGIPADSPIRCIPISGDGFVLTFGYIMGKDHPPSVQAAECISLIRSCYRPKDRS